MRTTIGVAALGAALVLGTGCGAAADKAAERATEEAIEEAAGGGQVDIDDDGNVQIETEDGSTSYGTGELPEGWPEDVPLPEGADIAAATSTPSGGQARMTVGFSVDEDLTAVADFYEAELSGWTEQTERSFAAEGSFAVTYVDGDREVTISATELGGTTTAGVNYVAPG